MRKTKKKISKDDQVIWTMPYSGKFAREPMRAKVWLVNGESITILVQLPDGSESFRTTSLSRIAKVDAD